MTGLIGLILFFIAFLLFVSGVFYFGRLDRKSVFTLRQVPPNARVSTPKKPSIDALVSEYELANRLYMTLKGK